MGDRSWRRFLFVVGPLFTAAILTGVFLPGTRRLVALFFYSMPANSFVPVPHELGMIYFGQYEHPAWVALVAAVGTVVVCFVDYRVIARAFRAKRLRRVRQSGVYRGAVAYFLRAPFACVLLAAALPFIPFYIFRVLSPTAGYPLRRYMTAVFIGRLPRYYVFALMGNVLEGANLILSLALIVAACLLLSRRVKSHLASRNAIPQPVLASVPEAGARAEELAAR